MTDEKLNEAHFQRNHLWTGGNAIRELHKITSIPKKGRQDVVSKTSTLASSYTTS